MQSSLHKINLKHQSYGQLWCIIYIIPLQMISIQKQPICDKSVWPQEARTVKSEVAMVGYNDNSGKFGTES